MRSALESTKKKKIICVNFDEELTTFLCDVVGLDTSLASLVRPGTRIGSITFFKAPRDSGLPS